MDEGKLSRSLLIVEGAAIFADHPLYRQMPDPVTPPPTPKPPSKLRQIAIKAAVAVGVALIAFLVGWFVGRGPVGDLQERAAAAESHLALMQDHLHITDAASLLYQTALDLDARNFGTANDRLDEAASVLQLVGVAGSALESLRSTVASTDINVAQNLAGQRAAVLGFAEALQGLMASGQDVPAEGVGDGE